MDDYDFIYKIMLFGDDYVGKTSFLERYIEDKFTDNPIPTIGVEFRMKTIQMKDGKKVRLQIWDTAGREEFKSILVGYFRRVNGIILFYDISTRESFKNLENWLDFIRNNVSKTESPYIFLVGNKIYLEQQREITTGEGEKFAKEYGLTFFESSAKTGKNVDLIFIELVKVMNKDPVFQKIQEKLAIERMKEKKKKEDEEKKKNIKKNLKILDKYISF